jgi:PAS domain S-box-containing protein
LNAASQERLEFNVEYRVLWPDGTVRWLVDRGKASYDENGRATSMAGVNIDITQRKLAEAAVAESRGRLDAALGSMTDAVFISDAAGKFQEFNPACTSYYRFKNRDECARSFEDLTQVLDVFFPDGSPTPREMWAMPRALRGETALNAEYGLRRKDTGESWIGSYSFAPIRDKEGAIVGSVVVGRDITESKRAERALVESERRFSVMFEKTAVGIVLSRMPGGTITDVNEAWVKAFGYSKEEAAGKTPGELGLYAFPEQRARVVGELLERGAVRDLEILLRTRAGEARTFAMNIELVEMAGGQYALASVQDISERVQAQHERAELNATLERRVRERTAQLEAANQELEAFAYSVSHDLRAPLRGIDGWSLALLEDCHDRLDRRGSEYLGRVRSETQRMGLLIDDLLQLSRIGRQEMRRQRVDLAAIAERIAARLEEAHPGRRIEFAIQPELAGYGDPRLLEVALTNLFGNAVKFTGPRKAARIEFGRQQNGGGCPYYVRDNGVGFEMAYAGALFGAFQRLHHASEFPGSGIGLATVQRIIHRHGGRVWGEGQIGAGATFYFTLGGSE